MRHIRTAARALIVSDRKLLAIRMKDQSGTFYILPGGGQKHGETLLDTLKRECLEEIGCEVEAVELLYIREYIGKNHEFRKAHRAFHQVEHVFKCTINDPASVGLGHELDKKQVGVEWIPIENISERRFLPEAIKAFFQDGQFCPHERYLGDVN